MRTLLIILFCLKSLNVFAQFFYTQTKPQTKYLVNEYTSQTQENKNILYNSVDQSLTIAAWVDIHNFTCNGFLFGSDQIKVSSIKVDDKYKIRFSLKDSISIEGNTFQLFGESDIFSPAIMNTHIVVTYDGSGLPSGMSIYINGAKIGNDIVTNLGEPVLSATQTLKISSTGCNVNVYNIHNYNYDLIQSQVLTLFQDVDATAGTPNVSFYGSEKYKQSGFFKNVFQKWIVPNGGRLVSVPVWGDEANSSLDYRSPIGGGVFDGPFILYNETQQKSYIATGARGGPGFARSYYPSVFNHDNNTFVIDRKIDGATPLIQDYHHKGRIALGKDTSLIHFSEKSHNGDLYIDKQSNYNGNFSRVDSITGGQLAYAQPFYLGSNLFVIGRKNYQSNSIYKSTDNGETWGSENVIAQMATNDWAYFYTYTSGDSILYLGIINRNQSAGGEYDKTFLLTSTDGENFCNISGNRCEDITSGLWDINELRAHAAIDSTTDNSNSVGYTHFVTDNLGRFHMIRGNSQLDFRVHAMYDSGWTYDTIENTINSRFPVMVCKGGNSFDLWSIVDEGATEKIVKKTTTNNFQSFDDEQTIFVNTYSENGRMLLNVTANQKENNPVIIATPVNIDDIRQQSALFIYEYNPWNQL